jgi:hypothetical protein
MHSSPPMTAESMRSFVINSNTPHIEDYKKRQTFQKRFLMFKKGLGKNSSALAEIKIEKLTERYERRSARMTASSPVK